MREILFRGKRFGIGEWVEGYYLKAKLYRSDDELCDFIAVPHQETKGQPSEHFWVDPETVGQFTGLTDTKGEKIFEGDIVHVHDRLLRCDAPYHEFDGTIEHKNGSFVIADDLMTHYRWLDYDVTVIGNIHDNPELLEVTE